MDWFFTSDEHHLHKMILKYRAMFSSLEEMTEVLIERHNEVVPKRNAMTVHVGDFCFGKRTEAEKIINRLNGDHIFILGNHDKWLPENTRQIWSRYIDLTYVVVCHYPIHVWKHKEYGSIHIHGHMHDPFFYNRWAYQVNSEFHNFYPVSLDEIISTIAKRK